MHCHNIVICHMTSSLDSSAVYMLLSVLQFLIFNLEKTCFKNKVQCNSEKGRLFLNCCRQDSI